MKNLDVVKSIEIPESNDTKDEIFTHDGNSFYGDLVNVKIPESFTSIGHVAFAYCMKLTSIDIPDSVTSIGNSAFFDCSKLTSVNIPDGITSIDRHTFSGCTSLTSIALPSSVTEIGVSAFNNCSSLKTINFKGTEDQWNAITKELNWNSGCPSDMQIICNYQGE